MLLASPLDFLFAFVVCFTLGAVWTMGASCYVGHVQRKTMAPHA